MSGSRGKVVVFTQKNCTYCVYVTQLLRSRVNQINKEFQEKAELEGKGEAGQTGQTAVRPSLSLETYDCSDAARAAQCISFAGGTSTVPHVFFNRKYVGDADTLIEMETNNLDHLLDLLREAAREECHDFPPAPEASMIKVTETEAFSSQPTVNQLKGLCHFGFKSVINLLEINDQAYCKSEGQIVKDSGLDYFHLPFGFQEDQSQLVNNAKHILCCITSCRKPALIHCDTGRRSCELTLLHADKIMKAGVSQVQTWGNDLGHDFYVKSGIPYAWVSSFLSNYENQLAIEDLPEVHLASENADQCRTTIPSSANRLVEQVEDLNLAQVASAETPTDSPSQVLKQAEALPDRSAPAASYLANQHPAPPLPPSGKIIKKRSSNTKQTTEVLSNNIVSQNSKDSAQVAWRKKYLLHAAACGAGEISLEDVLLLPEVNLELLDSEGWTALHYASWNGLHESVRLLIKAGANVSTRTGEARNTTPLHYAAGMGHQTCVQLLLDAGADPAAKDAEGWTPGRVALEMSSDKTFKNQSGTIAQDVWDSILSMCKP